MRRLGIVVVQLFLNRKMPKWGPRRMNSFLVGRSDSPVIATIRKIEDCSAGTELSRNLEVWVLGPTDFKFRIECKRDRFPPQNDLFSILRAGLKAGTWGGRYDDWDSWGRVLIGLRKH